MKDRIEIKGLFGFGHHGVFEDEREVGQGFLVDVVLFADLREIAKNDLIGETISYSDVCELVFGHIVGPPVSLIETLTNKIADAILEKFPKVDSVQVTVHKPDAPIGLKFQDVSVSIERSR